MNICVAQTKPIKGDIQKNIEHHKHLVNLAASKDAHLIIFPELSITGYEPSLASELAMDINDSRLDDFQEISDLKNITIGVGIPAKNSLAVYIAMVLFQPHQPRTAYFKEYLHPDEEPFFVSGVNAVGLIGSEANIALAICYEISVPRHSEKAYQNGAQIYIASVAKSASGVEKAAASLSAIAKKYAMAVIMSNCIGYCDSFKCGGQSAVWNNKGELVVQLNKHEEGLIVYDSKTGKIVTQIVSS